MLGMLLVRSQRCQDPVKGSPAFWLPPSQLLRILTGRLPGEYNAAIWMATAHSCRHLSCGRKSKVVAVNRGSPAAREGGPMNLPQLDEFLFLHHHRMQNTHTNCQGKHFVPKAGHSGGATPYCAKGACWMHDLRFARSPPMTQVTLSTASQ